ncbi:MAG: hypothetical protein K0Q79_1468 [Flavipsychrobacter sp.]|jgi:transcriptional regulator with GAF, ATPase, and Fis domain|nr:hypothetical protein [Flavipsychrobacter sp.]
MERVLPQVPRGVFKELDILLAGAIKLNAASKGMLHIYDKQKDMLTIVSHAGLSNEFISHFEKVKLFDTSACGRAAGTGNVIVIGDVTKDLAYKPHLTFSMAEGIKAVQATPLFEGKRLVGTLTIHFENTKSSTTRSTVAPSYPEITSLLYEIIKQKENSL